MGGTHCLVPPAKYLSFSFSATFTSPISIGTSIKGPITAAKASWEAMPKTPTANGDGQLEVVAGRGEGESSRVLVVDSEFPAALPWALTVRAGPFPAQSSGKHWDPSCPPLQLQPASTTRAKVIKEITRIPIALNFVMDQTYLLS